MPAPQWVPGYDKSPTFQLTGGSAVTLLVTSTSWDESVRKLETTHSGSGGKAAAIAGILDGEGTVEANVNAANLPSDASPGIVAGAQGIYTMDVGGGTPGSYPVLILRLNWRTVVDGLVKYSFQATLNSDGGDYTRPES